MEQNITIFVDTGTVYENELFVIEHSPVESVSEYREKIVDAFVTSLRAKRNWTVAWGAEAPCPVSGTGGKYRGLNRLWLNYCKAAKGYTDERWYTAEQIYRAGGKLAEGAEPEIVEYWLPYDENKGAIVSWNTYRMRSETAEMKLQAQYVEVYNASTISGIPQKRKLDKKEQDVTGILNTLIENLDVNILNDGGGFAYYRSEADTIHLPRKDYFQQEEKYQSVLLRQLAYASGHASRLCRNMARGFDNQSWAQETLLVRLMHCYADELPLQGGVDLATPVSISEWENLITAGPERLFSILKDAERAADFLTVSAGLISQGEYRKRSEEALQLDESKIVNYKKQEYNYLSRPNRKAYVKEFITRFFENYDFNAPLTVQGKLVPAVMLQEELEHGGMFSSEEDCKNFIEADPEAAENTQQYILDKYPELQHLTKESDPRRFSLIMMERELYKMISAADDIEYNWDNPFIFGRKTAVDICKMNRIKLPENLALHRRKVCELEIE